MLTQQESENSYTKKNKLSLLDRVNNLYNIVELLEYRIFELENKIKTLESK